VAIKPKPRLNRAGRIYVALTGVGEVAGDFGGGDSFGGGGATGSW